MARSMPTPGGKLPVLGQSAVQRGDLSRALELMDSYHSGGGEPQLWMFDMLINLHARRRDMPSALAVQDLMRAKGLAPTQYVYNSLAVACSRARPTGYNLPKDAVRAAETVLRDMAARGVPRDFTSYSIMMDVYAKAGMLAEAESQMALLQAAGGTVGAREYAALLEACKRSNRPARAAHILHSEMADAGVAPDARAWNALLGAYGRNGDIDGAYATWQEMMQRRVVPSDVTERELAEAFSSSPAFATDVVQQCKSFRALLEAGGPPPVPGSSTPPGSGSLLVAAFHVQGWVNWLLHGMRHPAAVPADAPPPTPPAPAADPAQRTATPAPPYPPAAPASPATAAATAHSAGAPAADSGGGNLEPEQGAGKAAAQPVAAPAAAVLDIHRMNQAQARAAVLQQLHTLSTAMPRAEVDTEHLRVVAGAVRYPLGTSPEATPAFPDSSASLPSESQAAPRLLGMSWARGEAPAQEPLSAPQEDGAGPGRPAAPGTAPGQQPGASTGTSAADAPLHPRDPSSSSADTHMHAAHASAPEHPGADAAGARSAPMRDSSGAHARTADSPAAAAESTAEPAPGRMDGGTVSRGEGEAGGLRGGESVAAPRAGAGSEPAGGLVIIMGRGRTGASIARDTSEATLLDQNPLQLAVRDLLSSLQVGYREVEDNPGRLLVPRAELLRFAARSQHRGEQHAMMRRMLFRALALSVAASGLMQLMSDTTWPRLFIFVEDHF